MRTQLIISAIGLSVIGTLLYSHSLDVEALFVPAAGGTYTEAIVGIPEMHNPLLVSRNLADRDLNALLHAGLMRFDSTGLPVPDLAESWAVSADGLAYTFVLRSGLVWQDGTALTLDDVIFTIELMQHPEFPGATDLAELWRVVGLIKLSDSMLKLTIPEPYAPFLENITFSVLPAHVFSGIAPEEIGVHPVNLAPVGAGPFSLETIISGADMQFEEALLVANPHYHGKQPMLSKLRMLFYPDEPSAVHALLNGHVMGIGNLSPINVHELLKDPKINMYTGQLPEYHMILLNQRNESLAFFQEKKVRQALLAGLNRSSIVDDILNGQGIVATGPILQGTWAYNSDLSAVEYEPQRAIGLLEAANWFIQDTMQLDATSPVRQKNGKDLKFTLLVPDDQVSMEIGKLAMANWEMLGIQTTMEVTSSSKLESDHLIGRRFEALLVKLSLSGSPDPDPYPFWHQTEIETGQNYSGYDSRRISELLEQARVINSLAERSLIYAAFQAHFADQTPALLLYSPVYSYAINSQVRGIQMGPLTEPSDRFQNIADWYMITKRVVASSSGEMEVE